MPTTFAVSFGTYAEPSWIGMKVNVRRSAPYVDGSGNVSEVTWSATIGSDGTASLSGLPYNDDGSTYSAEWQALSYKSTPGNRVFQVPSSSGITVQDFDGLPAASTATFGPPVVPLVTSVNGHAGAVTLGKADVGLGSVDNTADTAKPVSTAQATALAAKAVIADIPTAGTATGDALRAAYVSYAPAPSGGDDSAALTAAGNALPGGKGVLVLKPGSTYIAQGLPIRDGLYYQCYGVSINLPASPTSAMFKTTGQAFVTSGGVYGAVLTGNGGQAGVGATQNALDFITLDRLDRFDVHDCTIQNFNYGVRGSENGGIGNDRFLHIQGCRIWDNLIGVKSNEHAVMVSNDFRENDVGLTGRINDMIVTGCKFAYNRVGAQPEATRGAMDNATFTGCQWYYNQTGLILGNNCLVESSAIDSNGLAGSVGIQVNGVHNVITGFRANQASSVECETTFLLTSGASSTTISNGYAHQYTAGRKVVGLSAQVNDVVVANVNMTLDGGSHGIWSDTFNIIRGGMSGCQVSLTGDGRVVSVPQFWYAKIIGNGINVSGATLTGAAINLANNGNVGSVVIGNVVTSSSGGTGVGINADARTKGVVADNAVLNGITMTLANSDTTSVVRSNGGFVTKANGIATVPSGATFIQITHGLGRTPSAKDISITPANNLGAASRFWVATVGATTFSIVVDVDPGAVTAKFAWSADVV